MAEVLFCWSETRGGQSGQEQRRLTGDGSQSLLNLALAGQVPIEANCGGRGRCGKCKVKVQGEVSPLDEVERQVLSEKELAHSTRLACRCYPRGDVTVSFVTTSELEILTDGVAEVVSLEPDVQAKAIYVDAPTLEQPTADWTRVARAVGVSEGSTSLPLEVLQELPAAVRSEGVLQAVSYGSQILDVRVTSEPIYGLAIDVGTTTVAVGLNNLWTGEEVAVAAAMNGQANYGADVISRIDYASDSTGLKRLQSAVLDTINTLISQVCREVGISPQRIYRGIIVGNTCMQHLILGVPPKYLAEAPYVPSFANTITYSAQEVGLEIFPSAPVSLLPSIAGFVGADTVGMIVAADLAGLPGSHLAIDIGTNGEIVLAKDGKLYACSTAAGPAFEGGQIQWGMRAAPGAVDRVDVVEGALQWRTIGNQRAVGICGSGLIDLMAALLQVGVVDDTGRLLTRDEFAGPPELRQRLVDSQYGPAFVVVPPEAAKGGDPVLFTHRDVRQVQLAKAAIQAGSQVLADHAGVELSQLTSVHLAGAFGNYIRPESAAAIGLLPPDSPGKVRSLGNAARMGARMALLSDRILHGCQTLSDGVEYIELSTSPDFQIAFMEAMMFPG